MERVWDSKMIWLLVWLLVWAVWDLRYRVIPFWQVILVISVGVVWQVCSGQLWTAGVLVGLVAGGITWIISWLTQEQLGQGDAMVILCMGLYLGIAKCMEALLWGLMAAALVSLYLLVWKKTSRHQGIPFIPFLTMGYLAVLIMTLAGGK